MYVLIVGDTHGNKADILPKIYKAGEHRIQHVLVCGDFGLWTHFAEGHEFLDEVNEAARINSLSVYAVGGNHENWDHWEWYCENHPTSKGFALARRRVLLAPKTHNWFWAGKRFIGAGGAVSVDKAYRLQEEKRVKTLWWPNEQLLDADVDVIKTWGRADYLITHDCSNYTQFHGRLKPDMDSQVHRQRIDAVLKTVQPKFHFHGHMHDKYDWINEYSGGGARTIGLQAFTDPYSWGVLEVETGQWFWPDEFDAHRQARVERKAEHDAERYARSVD